MSSLYLDRKNLGIKLDGQALALYEDGTRKGSVPLHLLDRVVLRGNVQLESRVLGALSERNIGLLVLSGRNTEATAMLAGRAHSDSARRLGQYAISMDPDLRMPLARWLVLVKVRSQLRLLKEAIHERADLRHPLTGAVQTLSGIIGRLREEQLTQSLESLRGYEGAAAAAYFGGFTRLFAPCLNFTGRHKRPPPDPVNVCLSLGYTLLHYDAVRVCHIVGLDSMLGFYHDVSFGRESLACDLMEPLRPIMDNWVWQMFRERELRQEHFSADNGRCLLNKTGRQRFYGFYESHAGAARRLLRRYAHALNKRYQLVYEAR
ncbi:MAG: CRISPR-associated endonuclease Cas1 [Methylomonas sp.]|jgi:CRISPR-associated protein Cas1|uniref:CRISPR-associated endonuclease Cas1 n=1 Tax=Methylomonas sp. TaxID=418 RepID=UPI0025EAB123|nr:CRISPR-associated endonuclease Cas1 [Methylomonas sp.]MCK9607776.1 CRISPR-associated endonuclease Cas1 [Methylomonas sp.]